MATQTHQLNIKAKLDTSEVRAELDKLNQNRGPGAGGAQGQGAAQRTTQLLSKLDGTLSKLNATITRLAEAMKRPLPSGMSPRMHSGSSEYFTAKAFGLMTDREFSDAVRKIDKHRPDIMVGAAAGLTGQELEVLKLRGIISDSTAAKISAAKKAQPLNPPIVSQNVMHVFPDRSFQIAPRDAPIQDIQQPSASGANGFNPRAFRQQLRAFGIGTATSFVAGQLSQWGELTDNIGLNAAGSFLGGAGSGAMTGAIFGPWGAAIGAVLGGVSQGALELVKSFKTLDEQVKKTRELMDVVKVSSGGSLDSILAGRVVLGAPADAMLEKSQQNLKELKSQREDILARELSLSQGDQTKETIKQLRQLAKHREVIEKEIASEENVISTINDRKRALEAEVQSGQKLAQAEIEFAESIRRNEEAERSRYYSSSEKNVQAYREAQRQHREQMHQRDIQTADYQREMDFQRSHAEIRLGMWRGGTAEDYFREARTQRQSLLVLNAARSHETDPQKLRQFNEDIIAMQRQFQISMSLAQALKIMQIGQPVNRVDLQSLTSLAGRGGWMGEQYRQPEYMSTLDKMYDTLKSIDDNTRAAEKSVWQ